ncbi:MAG: hypothetical protein WBV93_11300 [Anaerobacillus sp.]
MKVILSQPFVKVERKIDIDGQRSIEEEYDLTLYEDGIRAGKEHFAIQDIFDISYRFTSALYGFLYLHTKSGVFSFIIKESPTVFITEYRKLV